MAVDSWLFHQCRRGHHPPTLRFYTWFPVTLSLGYFQKRWPPHWSKTTWKGRKLELVRRPSGGRGVLHHGDLTYSLTCPMTGYTHSEAYVLLCDFLIQGWSDLGLDLEFGSTGRGYHHEANCFRLATSADLVDGNGEKFIGSAQLWRGETVLQHGSMALNPDINLQNLVFGASSSLHHTPRLWKNELTTFKIVIETLKTAAQSALEIELNDQPISDKEWREIKGYIPQTCVEPAQSHTSSP